MFYISKLCHSSSSTRHCWVVIWGWTDTQQQRERSEGSHRLEACTHLLGTVKWCICIALIASFSTSARHVCLVWTLLGQPHIIWQASLSLPVPLHLTYVSSRDRQCVLSLPPPFFPWLSILVLHTQNYFSFTVQPNRKSVKQKRSKHLSDSTLTVWKLHHFSVARSSTTKSWRMGDCYLPDQFGISAGILQVLEVMMQRYLNAKWTQVNQARAASISPGGWEGGWRQNLEPSCWIFHAPGCRKSHCSGMEQRLPVEAAWAWLPVNPPCINHVHRSEGLLLESAWTKAESLSSCSSICASCFRSFTVPGIPALYFPS